MKWILSKRFVCLLAVVAVFLALPHASSAVTLTVLTVPVAPATPTYPHTTYPVTSTTESNIILGATVPSAVGSSDAFTYSWAFGDGTSTASAPVTNPYDISVQHQYPASAAAGTAWSATVTVKDTTSGASGSAIYYVTQETNTLNSRVNVAIDWGLWYMHQTMWRGTTTAYGGTINWGGWDENGTGTCPTVNGEAYDCSPYGYGVINAENVQAFEVSGHFANGSATDPYTDDVARGINRLTSFLASTPVVANTYDYNPATVNYTCKDGTYPTSADATCTTHGGELLYNAGATSCTAPPCNITYDSNSNGLMAYSADGSSEYIYTTSPFLDALVASGTPTAKALTGPSGILGETYQNIVADILDYYGYSQYEHDYDLGNPATPGYYRGGAFSASGGAWLYDPQEGDDNSTSQWAAIGYISGLRGAGIATPKSITDFNNVWITNSQDVQDPAPTGAAPWNTSCGACDDLGAFGYRGSFYFSNEWGPFAVTPSGMVQMDMDGIGRTTNTAFGDASTAADQRWNNTETFYADNFCNNVTSGAYYAPRNYTYGMYSFTKSMLLHDPAGSLTPIQFLRTQTAGVFPGNSTTSPPAPKNTIDWYAAVSAADGGTDVCDGVAQTLIDYQQNPAVGVYDGHWFGNDYYYTQEQFETAWSIIMLRKTVFVTCITNLYGAGTAGKGSKAARVDLTWSGQTNATSYNVLRSSTNGGPYVQIGVSTITGYTDLTGVNGATYYYVVQPVNGASEICQSNQEAVTIP
jgi:hypothetical protein